MEEKGEGIYSKLNILPSNASGINLFKVGKEKGDEIHFKLNILPSNTSE